MGRVQNPAEGAFRGAGRRGRFVFLGLLEGDPGLAFFGKQERGSAQALRKNARDQREKCVFVLTKGMSLIGPRPALPAEVVQYDERARRRLTVKPGCGGAWQVGSRSDSTFEEMIDLDLGGIVSRKGRELAVLASDIIIALNSVGSNSGGMVPFALMIFTFTFRIEALPWPPARE